MAPEAGQPLSMKDFEEVMDAVGQRRKNFPNEPAKLSFYLVFQNIGDRYSEVTCSEGEFTSIKYDIAKPSEGDPKCPNGHELEVGPPLKIGWVRGE